MVDHWFAQKAYPGVGHVDRGCHHRPVGKLDSEMMLGHGPNETVS